ncbi:Homoserine kinase [Planctomycetes bacterium Pla163]|uniref:Homoserine kinase n=1 Tax=Rohdeia mirabilis TaxID=2528008 RepID=A0A518CYZ8_9BACT|nr:Homoserine kinase [Planctomycetes bacterium Pla163]
MSATWNRSTSPPRLDLSVRVPASTSNLGPGFDLLGLCLDLFATVTAEVRDDGLGRVETDGSAGWLENVLIESARAGLELGAAPDLSMRLGLSNEIPVARGLGSSGAAVAAGLLLGATAAGTRSQAELERSALVDAAVELEGHPDNAVAALFGGCRLSLRTATGWRVVHQTVHPSIGFALAWPEAPLATARARAVLPEQVPFAAAADNPRRLAALLAGLCTGDVQLLTHGLVDHLHEPWRLPLIAGAAEALAAARAAGAFGATLSGSGSTLVAVGPVDRAPHLARVLGDELARHGALGGARAAALVEDAPRVEVVRSRDGSAW